MSQSVANDLSIQSLQAGNTDQSQLSRLFICDTWCKAVRESLL